MEKRNKRMVEDEDLIAQFSAGKVQSFEPLFHKYHDQVILWAFHYVKNKMDAKDISQQVWLKIWELSNKPHQKNLDNFKAYLFQVVKNKSLDFLKSKGRTRIKKESHEIIAILPSSSNFIDQLEDKDTLKKAMEKFSGLPPMQAKVFWLRVIENYSYEAIAYRLGISIRAAEGQVRRATARMKKFRDNNFMDQ